MKKLLPLFFAATLLVLTASGCGTSSFPTATLVPPTATPPPPTETPTPTATTTPIPPTETPTPIPTATPIPPTRTPIPPTPTSSPATDTVCASGCDFTTIQAAIDDPSTEDGAIIKVTDPVHTEAGIVVNKGVTIRGLGADNTIVQAHDEPGEASERVFYVEEGATVILESMTIRHGRPLPKEEEGGGINNYGTLTIKNCIVTNNSAIGGGGVSSRGTLTIIASTISDNVARGDGPPGLECGGGGGVKGSAGTLTIINSTITGNQGGLRSAGLGGGIRTGCGCTAEIINSTISGNKAVDFGGGIAAAGTVQITNCTVSNNAVTGSGGGLWVRGEVNLENTIVADNIGSRNCTIGGEGGHVGTGSFGINRNNLIEDGSCNADFSGDPNLGPLADNGGDTKTHALLPGSPAIDAIPAISCTLPTDQRGALRPVVQTSSDTPCDIGAFELQTESSAAAPAPLYQDGSLSVIFPLETTEVHGGQALRVTISLPNDKKTRSHH